MIPEKYPRLTQKLLSAEVLAECAIETTTHREEIYRQLKEAGYVWSSVKADWTKAGDNAQKGIRKC